MSPLDCHTGCGRPDLHSPPSRLCRAIGAFQRPLKQQNCPSPTSWHSGSQGGDGKVGHGSLEPCVLGKGLVPCLHHEKATVARGGGVGRFAEGIFFFCILQQTKDTSFSPPVSLVQNQLTLPCKVFISGSKKVEASGNKESGEESCSGCRAKEFSPPAFHRLFLPRPHQLVHKSLPGSSLETFKANRRHSATCAS